MKNKKLTTIVFIIIAALIMTFTACSGSSSSSSMEVTKAQMATNIDTNKLPIDEVTSYAPNIKQMCFTFTVENMTEDKNLYFVLKRNNEQIQKSGTYKLKAKDKVDLYYTFERGEQNWDEGNYQAEVYVSGEEKPAKSVKFTVSSKKADIFITDVRMTTNVEGGIAVDSVTNYNTNAEKIIVSGIARNAPNNTMIKVILKLPGDTDSTGYWDTKDYAVTYFHLQFTQSIPWEQGNYTAEIYINDNKKPVQTINFTVSDQTNQIK